MAKLASTHRIRTHAARLLGDGALSARDLIAQLRDADLDLGSDPTDRLLSALDGHPDFFEVHDDHWVHLTALLDGVRWVTVVPDELPEPDCLPTEPDLTLLAWWSMDAPRAIAGGDDAAVVTCVELDDGESALLGPDGWLSDLAGRPLVVAAAGETVMLDPLDVVPRVSPEQAAAVRDAFASYAEPFLPDDPDAGVDVIGVEDLLSEALLVSRGAFRVHVGPVDALLRAAGLERRDHLVGRLDTDWDAIDDVGYRRRIGARYSLDDKQVEDVEILLGATYAVLDGVTDPLGPPDEEPETAFQLTWALLDPEVARAYAGTLADLPPEDLATFARRLLAHDPPAAAGVRWLLARSLDRTGRPLEAEAELELALADDTHHPLALRALAGFRSDRGDAKGALALVERARETEDRDNEDEDDEDYLYDEVMPYARHRPTATVGRNEPCPCGSGRKYKACHLGEELHPLIERGPWLYHKAHRYLRDGEYRPLAAEVAHEIARASRRGYELLLGLLDSPLPADVALCEGGVFGHFLASRDALLPDDEALVAAQWSVITRSIFEVERVGRDELALRDLRTGDHIVVTNVTPSEHTRAGSLFIGRPLPVADTWRAFSGFVPITDRLRDEAMDILDAGDLLEVAELIGRCAAPPVLTNTDGQDLVFHDLTYALDDTDAAIAALRTDGRLEDHGDGTFALKRDTPGMANAIVAFVTVEGTELRVSVNSDERAEEIAALVDQVLPTATLVDHDLIDADEALAERGVSGRPLDDDGEDSPILDPDDPQVAEALTEYVRAAERRWVDEPVPALRGATPRQALDDPIGRVELERLLVSFDDMPKGPGAMDPDRIRALLGLR